MEFEWEFLQSAMSMFYIWVTMHRWMSMEASWNTMAETLGRHCAASPSGRTTWSRRSALKKAGICGEKKLVQSVANFGFHVWFFPKLSKHVKTDIDEIDHAEILTTLYQQRAKATVLKPWLPLRPGAVRSWKPTPAASPCGRTLAPILVAASATNPADWNRKLMKTVAV